MDIFPAIDLRNQKVVRLVQGDYNQETVYDDDPVRVAKGFQTIGATHLHVVDLDGAKMGVPFNLEVVERICKETELFIQVGGGIRDHKRVKKYLEMGVDRVILGTAAINNPEFLKEMIERYGERIGVGVDAHENMVAVNGWLETTQVDSFNFCQQLRDLGVKTVIYTDISKDGKMEGTNMDIYRKLSQIKGLDVVASGGISFEEEVVSLTSLVRGAIIGKAIYQGTLDLSRCIKLSGEK